MDAVWPDTFVTESSLLEAIGLLRDARVVIEIAGTIGLLFIHRNVIPVVDAIFKKDGLVVFEPMAFGDELGLIDEGRNTGRTALQAVRDLGGSRDLTKDAMFGGVHAPIIREVL